jgi:hypothetical protein
MLHQNDQALVAGENAAVDLFVARSELSYPLILGVNAALGTVALIEVVVHHARPKGSELIDSFSRFAVLPKSGSARVCTGKTAPQRVHSI